MKYDVQILYITDGILEISKSGPMVTTDNSRVYPLVPELIKKQNNGKFKSISR